MELRRGKQQLEGPDHYFQACLHRGREEILGQAMAGIVTQTRKNSYRSTALSV